MLSHALGCDMAHSEVVFFIKSARFYKQVSGFIKFNICLCYRSGFNKCGTITELQHKFFLWFCICLLRAFSELLAFGSVKGVKNEFFIKGA